MDQTKDGSGENSEYCAQNGNNQSSGATLLDNLDQPMNLTHTDLLIQKS
ncbi:17955_t:CDS:2 [Cetraspora pellucida]|uniref:17955_t:CDS:1 n=1 Tax=Cetraspora pellucida TaxID=1433469 RepID=A0ACA9LZB0_9GLOM|nr:17955_t:CDS:2 [Cetraspora pellucida]